MTQILLLACAFSAWYMTGVIWTVQYVHYALFIRIGQGEWAKYHAEHMMRMTPIVLLPMIIELGSALGLVMLRIGKGTGQQVLLAVGLVLTLGAWAVTFAFSVPMHGRLSLGFDTQAMQRLVKTNWARTALWTGHGLVMLAVLWERLGNARVF